MKRALLVGLAVVALAVWADSLAHAYQGGCGCGCGGGGSCACGNGCCGNGMGDEDPAPELSAFTGLNIAQHSRISWTQFGNSSARGNDIWGWVDPLDNREYALVGRTDGTSFVDVTDPVNPRNVGFLPRTTGISTSSWRAIKVYEDTAYIAVDFAGNHGLQVFDLARLRGTSGPPVTYTPNSTMFGFAQAHTLAINPDSGFLYAAGTNLGNGLYMVDVRTPLSPTFAGFSSTPSYTHETQVTTYLGPDTTYQGREIAFSSTANTFTILDVENKSATTILARESYPNVQFSHQGWLTEDQHFFLMNDELDESNLGLPTRTHVWNVEDLNDPAYVGFYEGTTNSIDHNLYIRGRYAYLSNYTTGLRVVELNDIASLDLQEVGFFDTYMQSDNPTFNGAWTSYPYFPSGNIVVNDINNGLFVLSTVQTPGDANWDGRISGADFTIWGDNFGLHNGTATIADGDFNADGFVTGADFTIWNDRFGKGPLDIPSIYESQAIPEPAAAMLVMAGLVGLLPLLRRKTRS